MLRKITLFCNIHKIFNSLFVLWVMRVRSREFQHLFNLAKDILCVWYERSLSKRVVESNIFVLFSTMTYKRLIFCDANVGKLWQQMQSVRPELHEVSFRSASCLNTLFTALGVVSDQNDFVIVSEMTSLLIDEASFDEIKGSSMNVLEADAMDITSFAKRSPLCKASCLIC